MSISSTRIGKVKLAEGMLPSLVSVVLVAIATIVLFGVASISLLGIGKETLTRSGVDHSPIEEKVIGSVVPHMDSNAAPVPLQTKSPSSKAVTEPPSDSEASAAQRARVTTMPRVATSDEQLDQMSQNFQIQRNHHTNLDEGNVALTAQIYVPEEPKVKESTGFYGFAASPGADRASLHAAPRSRRAAKADRDNIADKLNRTELSGLLGGGRASRRAPLR